MHGVGVFGGGGGDGVVPRLQEGENVQEVHEGDFAGGQFPTG